VLLHVQYELVCMLYQLITIAVPEDMQVRKLQWPMEDRHACSSTL